MIFLPLYPGDPDACNGIFQTKKVKFDTQVYFLATNLPWENNQTVNNLNSLLLLVLFYDLPPHITIQFIPFLISVS